jgi:RNA recognition motif-containing protein
LEKIISVFGVDIMDGASLWGQLTAVQLSIVEDLVNVTANEDNIRRAKEALVSTYRRQYALPLLGNERSLSNFEKLLSEICVESDELWIRPELLLNRFQRSEDQLKARILYEQNIMSDEFLSSSLDDQVTAWKTYIRFEIDDKQLPRAHRLYERSVMTSHQSVELWLDFADFAESTLKNWGLVESVTSRAVKVHRGNIELWLLYLLAIESDSPPSSSLLLKSSGEQSAGCETGSAVEKKLLSAIKTALTCSFHSADDYLAILFYSCDFRRRKLKSTISSVPETHKSQEAINVLKAKLRNEVNALRGSFTEMENFLDACYPDWCGGWIQVYKYETALEDEIITDVGELFESDSLQLGEDADVSDSDDGEDNTCLQSQAGSVWERAVQRFSKYFFIWGDYIQWGRSAGDYDLCRNLYRRALKAVRDLPEEVCKAYRSFEQQVGTLDDFCLAKTRTKSIMRTASLRALKAAAAVREESKAKVMKKTLKAAATATAAAVIAGFATSTAANTIKREEVQSTFESTPNSSKGSSSNSTINLTGSKRVLACIPAEDREDSIGNTAIDIEQGASKRQKKNETAVPPGTAVASRSLTVTTTGTAICVKNLSFNSTIEEVMAHFQSCGTISGGNLLLSKAGKSRGQAVLHFADISGAIQAMQMVGSLLAGRAVEVEESAATLSVEGESAASSSSSKAPSAHHPTTVFVSKFSAEVTSEELKSMFSGCGHILEARVIVDKRTGLSKVCTAYSTEHSKFMIGFKHIPFFLILQCHGLVQFEEEAGKAAALCLNKKSCNGHVLSVLPSKFPALAEGTSASSYYGPASAIRASGKTDEREPHEKSSSR